MYLKKRISYGIFIILIFVVLYIGLRFAFGFFTPINFWKAKQDIENGKIQIIEIGEKPLNFQEKQKLANSFGFNFCLLGCNVNRDIYNGKEYYNKVMIEELEKKHGKGWWKKFQNKLEKIDKLKSEEQIIDRIIELVKIQKNVKEKSRLIDSLSKNKRHISFIPSQIDKLKNIYLVKVCEDNSISYVTYYNFLVNANLMTIINPNGKLENNE